MIFSLSKIFDVEILCKLFNFPRSSYYYRPKPRLVCSDYDELIKGIFRESRSIYGTRKIQAKLLKLGFNVSRRKISNIMEIHELVSKYVKSRKSRIKTGTNYASYQNLVNRHFRGRAPFEVIAADVTYVYFGSCRYYLCILVDIATRMIVGFSVDVEIGGMLVEEALASMNIDLSKIQIFHTDRGSEFNNIKINELLENNGILRSLSNVSAPLDNAIVESLNNVVKIEWLFGLHIKNLAEFKESWSEYVFWYNNHRIHGSLGYETPIAYMKILDKTS